MRRLVVIALALGGSLACGATRTQERFGDDTDSDAASSSDDPSGGDTDDDVPDDTGEPPIDLAVEINTYTLDAEVGDTDAYVEGEVVTRKRPLDETVLSVESSIQGPLPAPVWLPAPPRGRFRWSAAGLGVGDHILTFRAVAPGDVQAEAVLNFPVCAWPAVQRFDTNPIGSGWTALGDATWDSQGWMEITGFAQNRGGSVWLTERRIDPGNVSLAFDIATGGLGNSGADGYAVSVIDVPDVDDLLAWVATTQNGGCLGYGSSGACGSTPVNAFHIEFDTWYNQEYADPTWENHVAITLDGDPGNPLLWAAIPSLEDLRWRRVVVSTAGPRVTVTIDGAKILEGDIPDFSFDGGWIGVSGSTGSAYNYHRFDNLELRDRCTIPP